MTIRRHVVPVAVDADGDAEVYSPFISGDLCSISYVKTDFADGVDFTITVEGSGQGVWTEEDVNAAVTKYPRAATHSTAGAASLYAAGGQAVNDKISIARDRIKIVVASGGVSKSGAFHIVVDDGR